jgi:hypothetical protein
MAQAPLKLYQDTVEEILQPLHRNRSNEPINEGKKVHSKFVQGIYYCETRYSK